MRWVVIQAVWQGPGWFGSYASSMTEQRRGQLGRNKEVWAGGFKTTSQDETGRVAGQVAGEHGEGWARFLMTTWTTAWVEKCTLHNKRRFVLVPQPGGGRRRSRTGAALLAQP